MALVRHYLEGGETMGHLNEVIIYGAVCRDPVMRILPRSGVKHCQFQMAVNRPYTRTKPPSEMTREEEDAMTDYPWVYCRNALAEQVMRCVHTGTEVLVRGRMETRNVPQRYPFKLAYCPQCGAPLPEETLATCPSCNAVLETHAKMVCEVRAADVEFVANANYPNPRATKAPSDKLDIIETIEDPPTED
jgi:primosomal replication protein N